MSSAPQVEFSEALRVFFWAMMSDIHTCLPGKIDSYDYKKRKANVKPLIKKKLINGDAEELPVISNVPVIIPGTQDVGFSFPVNSGDFCLLLFSERALEKWLSSGGVTEPGDARKFDLTDALAIPGLFSFNQNNPINNNDDVCIYNKTQKIIIKKNGDIEIGSSSLKQLVNEAFLTAYDTHTHISASPTNPTGPPVVPSIPATHLTQKAKAQ